MKLKDRKSYGVSVRLKNMANKCEWCGKKPDKKGWVLCNKCSRKQNKEETSRFVEESGIFD